MSASALLAVRAGGLFLVGAGLGNVFAGPRGVAFWIGALLLLGGGLYLGFTHVASWVPFIRNPRPEFRRSNSEEVRSLFGRGYGVALACGIVGVGMLIGASAAPQPSGIAVLVAGVATLGLTMRDRRR